MGPHGEQRVREVYEAALTKPPGERSSYVARVAGPDTDLRERVEALLSGQQDTVLPGYEPGSDQAEQLLTPGTQIGTYRIDGPLGAGGMGVVYFATDTKLHRPAAIKVLPENLADPEARRRFQREAQLVSSLNHPHILTVYDAGEYQGREYLITEYVDGGTLRQWAARPRGWRAIVELLVGVADGIAVAHEAGILHRDIKPENILLAKNGYAKLADFGIAKLLESDPLADDPALRPAGGHSTHVGTLAYMSPEQWQGLPLDARSDVYSFGLVLHELLAGRRIETPDPALPRKLPPLPADVPAELRTLVTKALEAEPADRYQTMRELVIDLRRVARHPDAGMAAAPPLWRRSVVYVAAALAVLIVAVLVREYAQDRADTAAARNAIAVLPFENETGIADDLRITEGLSDDLRERLMALPGVSVQARASSVSFQGQDAALATIASTLGVGRLINGSFRRQGEMLDVRVEILDEKGFAVQPPLRFSRPDTQLLALQQEIAQQVGTVLAPEAAAGTGPVQTIPTAASESANMLILFGSHLEHEVKDELTVDEDKLSKAIDFYRQAVQADQASISAYSHLAGALLYLGDVDAAKASLERLVDLAGAKNAQAKPAELSEAYYTLALYRLRERAPDVEDAFVEAIRLNPNNADALGAYAQWLMTHPWLESAGPEKEDRYFRDAIRLDRQSLSRYADYAEYLGTPPGDMKALRELGREIEQRFPDARGYLKLARVYELAGDLDVGIAWGLRAYRQLEEDAASQSSRTVSPQLLAQDVLGQIAELYARIGEFAKASEFEPEPEIGQLFFRQRYEDLVTVAQEKTFENPDDVMVYILLAFAYNATGDYTNAQSLLERKLAFPRSDYGGGNTEVLAAEIYRDALQARGLNEQFVRNDAERFVADFELGMSKGWEHTWYMNVHLACGQAQLGRVADALDSLDRVKNAEGLVWSPLIEDSPCFKRVANEPRYLALVEHLDERQRMLRERLPATLEEYGVAAVRPYVQLEADASRR